MKYQFTSVRKFSSVQFSSVAQLCPTFATPWTAARQASLSIINSQSLLKLMSIELVMPSNHLILCCPLLLPPSILPSIRIFSNESIREGYYQKMEYEYWQKCGEIETSVHFWEKCKMVQPLQKTVWQFLKKLNIKLPYYPALPLLGIYSRKLKADLNRYLYTHVPGNILHNKQQIATMQVFSKRWIENMVYPHNGILFNWTIH